MLLITKSLIVFEIEIVHRFRWYIGSFTGSLYLLWYGIKGLVLENVTGVAKVEDGFPPRALSLLAAAKPSI